MAASAETDCSTDPTRWSIEAIASAFRRRELAPSELLQGHLAKIDQRNNSVNAVVTLDVEGATAAAQAADDDFARGEDGSGRLHGIPFTVKDAIETAGMRSTGGATELADYVPDRDAPAVRALREAGGILLGKTNCPTWCGDIQTHNPLFGRTNNPRNLALTAGGSSGGSAAAVSCAFTAFDLATDIGGSIRIPASYCGVFGHKPSYGLLSGNGYLSAPGSGCQEIDLNVLGPIARSAQDLDVLMKILVSASPKRRALPPPRHAVLSGFRLGLWIDDADLPLADDVRTCFEASVAAVERAGARIDVTHPDLKLGDMLDLAQAVLNVNGLVKGDASFGQTRTGNAHPAGVELTHRRRRMHRAWSAWFSDYDALLCPVMPMAAFPHDIDRPFNERFVQDDDLLWSHERMTAWTQMISVSYLPATVVPVGRTANGLPVGMQVVGPHLDDRTSIAVAAWVSEALRRG